MTITNSTIVVADDLTGANDTALQFFKTGATAKIIIDIQQDYTLLDDVEVLAFSTESRNVEKEVAVENVLNIVNKLCDNSLSSNLYKKIDSTLRGHVGLEVIAILEATKKDAVIIAPAYIEEKRTTIGSYQLLNGIPIERTQCALDPKSPVTESYIPTILQKNINSQLFSLIDSIHFNTISKGAGPIALKIKELIQKGKKIIIADAISTTDLEQIALAIKKSEYDIIPAGSAGLANAINKINDREYTKHHIEHIPNQPRLIVSGSATQLTYKQIQKLKQNRKIHSIDLKVKDVVQQDKSAIINEIIEQLKNNKDVIVHSSNMLDEIKHEEALNQLIDAGIPKNKFSSKITDFISDLIYEINLNTEFILILIGGETSYKCSNKINSKYLQIIDAILPAIPLCIDSNGKIIVTKSGNFGNIDTLIEVLEYFDKKK